MHPLLILLVCFGMVAVCLCFVVLMPTVGQILAVLFGVFAGERSVSKIQGKTSGSEFIDPKLLNGKESIE